jgi:hypothetical protein
MRSATSARPAGSVGHRWRRTCPTRDRPPREQGQRRCRTSRGESDRLHGRSAPRLCRSIGGSALRGTAFGKPLIVQGELGFWRLCTPETVEEFLEAGWFSLGNLAIAGEETGIGRGQSGCARSSSRSSTTRPSGMISGGSAGRWSWRQSRGAGAVQERVYSEALARKNQVHFSDAGMTAAGVASHYVRRKVRKWLGTEAIDDFHEISHLRAASIDRDVT